MITADDLKTTGSVTGTGTAVKFNEACGYKLPCGLCRLLMSQCPKDTSYPNITWTASDEIIANPCSDKTTIAEFSEQLAAVGRALLNEVQP